MSHPAALLCWHARCRPCSFRPLPQDEARSKFAAAEGDLVTHLNVWRAWLERGKDPRWCYRHFLNHSSLLKASEVQQQLVGHMRRMRLPLTSCNGDMEVLRRTIVQVRGTAPGPLFLCLSEGLTILRCHPKGMFINAACFDRIEYNPLSPESDPGTNVYRLIRPLPKGHQGVNLRIHNSSVLFRSRPPCVVFTQVQQSDDGWFEMQGVTAIKPEWLSELAPHVYCRR